MIHWCQAITNHIHILRRPWRPNFQMEILEPRAAPRPSAATFFCESLLAANAFHLCIGLSGPDSPDHRSRQVAIEYIYIYRTEGPDRNWTWKSWKTPSNRGVLCCIMVYCGFAPIMSCSCFFSVRLQGAGHTLLPRRWSKICSQSGPYQSSRAENLWNASN